MSARKRIRVPRVYDDAGSDDGQRVLVDRVWPRGVRKDDPRVGTWCKDVAPSKELREWYQHKPERFDEFASRYKAELRDSPALGELRKLTERGVVTLVYRDPRCRQQPGSRPRKPSEKPLRRSRGEALGRLAG